MISTFALIKFSVCAFLLKPRSITRLKVLISKYLHARLATQAAHSPFIEKLPLLLTHPSVDPLGEDQKFCALMVIIKHPPATCSRPLAFPSFIFLWKRVSEWLLALLCAMCSYIVKSILFSFGEIFSKWLHYRHVFYCACVCLRTHYNGEMPIFHPE
jgi:hypothetical protein